MNHRFKTKRTTSKKGQAPSTTHRSLSAKKPITFRPYQLDAFLNRSNGIECWLWGRQTGKSFTLAAWAVDRLITRPGRLVSILSNSRANGMELNFKCAEICQMYRHNFEQANLSSSSFEFESIAKNYECAFASENMSLLSYDLISQAEAEGVGFICENQWSREALELIKEEPTKGSLYIGVDVGRTFDWTVITVIEKRAPRLFVRGILRIRNLSLPQQQDRLGQICANRLFRHACIDMTGIGLGLYEYSRRQWGSRITGLNFARNVPLPSNYASEGGSATTVRVPELLALKLLRAYSDRLPQHSIDPILRDELRRPERLTSPSGQVSIAADRNSGGHADHFWSLALAVHAAQTPATGGFQVIPMPGRLHLPRHCLI